MCVCVCVCGGRGVGSVDVRLSVYFPAHQIHSEQESLGEQILSF